jgi:peptidoglycan/LPS O-acetylase OafA/YrhL
MFALFAQNYSLTTVMKINPVTWTLGVEVAFYLALPLIGALAFLLGRRLRLTPHVLLLVGLLAVTVGWNALVHFKGWNTLASKALPAYIGHFACGMLVALWAERRRARLGAGATLGRSATAVLFAAGAATVVASAYWHETSASFTLAGALLTTLPAAIGFAGVIAAAAIGSGFSVRWLGTRALAGVGVISYGVYLWHLPLLLVTRRLGLLTSLMIPRLAIVLAVTLPVAWLSWTRLERPLIKRGSRTREVAIRSPAPALARD